MKNQALDPIYMVHIRKEYYIHNFSSNIVKNPLWCTEGRVSYSDKKTHRFDYDIDIHSILSCTFQWTKVSKHIFSHFKTPVSNKNHGLMAIPKQCKIWRFPPSCEVGIIHTSTRAPQAYHKPTSAHKRHSSDHKRAKWIFPCRNFSQAQADY